MANLPAQHPTLSLHLADDTLTPLITSSRSRAHLESLTSLATSALTSQTAAHRVGMGVVERIMVEYPPPAAAAVVLQSYLQAPPAAECAPSETAPAAEGEEGDEEGEQHGVAPGLVSVVVARSPQDAREAKRAAARLERVGREFQSQWSATGVS
ncbi:hypothetical protein CCM_00533 [Cordyceps militaris CM01]|uniref:Uncharacterized protein n=2 Tax=Cordyceps militaris TaxID=73501 RepID=G3J4K9_CORMM|nr:uncharacterized protein CCM_00533 [Cordyceps militaris CM01]ATY66337.1 hypothetical protein A9K55_001586 [Cordyceps militaris]EGX95879.1 hypothetical protein CCM_00533 [Cordyceps militaris CM01]